MITDPHSTRWHGAALTCRTLTLAMVILGLGRLTAVQPGTVTSWGENVMPLVDPGTRYAAIAAGGPHTLALTSNRTVVAWRSGRFGQSTVPVELTGVVAIAAGPYSSFAIVASPVPSPKLQATLSGTNLVLSWPASAQNFILQATTNLTLPGSWTGLTNVPVIVNEQNTVTDPVFGAQRFDGLKQ